MKQLLFIVGLFIGFQVSYGQTPDQSRTALTVGILQGGGALFGADFEVLLDRSVGLQIGGGFRGYGTGINIHMRPEIRSSFVHLGYWHQGFGAYFAQDAMGASYVFRTRKGFTAQLGLARTLTQGPAWPEDMEQPPVMLIYSIGYYVTK